MSAVLYGGDVTSSTGEAIVTNRQRQISDRPAPVGNGTPGRWPRIVVACVMLTALLAAPIAVKAFLQSPDEPSPATGTAQVVAQGVIPVEAVDLMWQIVERTGPLPANADTLTSDLGFLVVESGVLLVEDLTNGRQVRLPAGEAMMTSARDQQIRAALGSDPARYRELTLVDAATESVPEDATLLFTSDPFAGPGARHDIDLLQDTLAADAQLPIPAGALPTLVLVRTGAVDIALASGDIISLGVGEAVSLTGSVQVTAAGDGATVVVASVGPVVPSLAQAAATPAAGRRVTDAPDATATAASAANAATPAPATDEEVSGPLAEDEAPVETAGPTDSDGDGLDDASESELGTDPLLWDTDSDEVSDGEEIAAGTDPLDPASFPVPADTASEASSLDSDADRLADADEAVVGTDPTNPDTDGDGYYDGDEVNLGTDPHDPASFPAG